MNKSTNQIIMDDKLISSNKLTDLWKETIDRLIKEERIKPSKVIYIQTHKINIEDLHSTPNPD